MERLIAYLKIAKEKQLTLDLGSLMSEYNLSLLEVRKAIEIVFG